MKYFFLLCILGLCACEKNKTTPDVTTGLVVIIGFDGNTTESVSGAIGSAYHVTYTTDHHNNVSRALLFTPTDSSTVDFGNLSNASFDTTIFTIACWIKVADTSASIAVLSKRNVTGPYEYSFDNHFNHAGFTLDNWIPGGANSVYGLDPLKAIAPVQVGQWEHIAYVADGNVLSVYVNGVLQTGTDQHNAGLNFGNTAANFTIGNGGGYGRNYYFNGAIDEVKIYNRALGADAIKYLAGL